MTTSVKRALLVLRLSRSTEESTSITRQLESCTTFAKAQGWEIVHAVEDVDVSGAVNPFKRDELGPWLTDRPPKPWDVIVAWKLDRVSRSARDGYELLEWLRARGKGIATVNDSINTFAPYSDIIFAVMLAVAQAERTATQERLLDSRAQLRRVGRHGAGPAPYGYRLLKLESGGFRWEQDPDEAAVLHEIIDRARKGASVRGICQDLTERGVPAPRDGHDVWHTASVLRILRSVTLLGQSTHDARINAELGEPILYTDDPILAHSEWSALQAALRTKSPYSDRAQSLLSGVAECGRCGGPMVASGTGKRESYVCRNSRARVRTCSGNVIVRRIADEAVYEYIDEAFAGVLYGYSETVYPERGVPDVELALESTKRGLERLMQDREDGLYDTAELDVRFRKQSAALRAKVAELTSELQSADEPVEIWHETEEFWTAKFSQATLDEKRRMLSEADWIRIRVMPHEPGEPPKYRVIITNR
jgi:site-specific DNA recombinase